MTIERDAAIAASGARTFAAAGLPAGFRISTDTRTLEPGDVFVAVRGTTFDGHAFIPEAVARGAAALVVSDPAVIPVGVPTLLVLDTTAALLEFARLARLRARAKIAAITGSAGKTTTKELLAQLLARTLGGGVAATLANENNEFGVAKLLLGLDGNLAALVVELGARHFGEIEPLARAVQPDIAILTNIGDAHLEIMGSPERLALTKWGIFATGALPILNADDAVSRSRAPSLQRQPEWFAARAGDAAMREDLGARQTIVVGRKRLVVHESSGTRSFDISCDLPGDHNLANLAAAAAGALALGVNAERVAESIAGLALPEGRYDRTAIGDFEVIYDAYNASMSGTLATLDSFAREPAARRVAVLGGMAELGDDAASMHERVGAAAAAAGLALLLVGGDFAAELERGARAAGFPADSTLRYASNAEAIALLHERVRPGDLMLLKASRKYKLEEIREGLRAVYA
jgi:UDP-N-acetylmuramoyl-tripeptide--D-alanyl-D-alanine ligase